MKNHIDAKEFSLLTRLEAEVRKLKGPQISSGVLAVIKEINEYRRSRAQIVAAQPQVQKWHP